MKRLLLCLAVAAASLVGVHGAVAQDSYVSAPSNALEVRLLRPVSNGNLVVSPPTFTPAGQLTRVHVELTNRSGRARTYEYEFEWFDAQGVPRQTLTATQSLFLDAGETQTLVSVGQRADAVNARLTIGLRRD